MLRPLDSIYYLLHAATSRKVEAAVLYMLSLPADSYIFSISFHHQYQYQYQSQSDIHIINYANQSMADYYNITIYIYNEKRNKQMKKKQISDGVAS